MFYPSIKIKKFRNVKSPIRAHKNDAGLDLYVPEPYTMIVEDNAVVIPMGIGIELEDGFMAQLIERSSIGKKGIILAKSPIDAGYRGEIHAIIPTNNPAKIAGMIKEGERLCQLVITPVATPEIIEVDELSSSERGTGAFGSTGKA